MKKQDKLIVLLDVLQIIVSFLTLTATVFILIYDNEEFSKIAFTGVSFIALILLVNGIGNLKIDYHIYKKYA